MSNEKLLAAREQAQRTLLAARQCHDDKAANKRDLSLMLGAAITSLDQMISTSGFAPGPAVKAPVEVHVTDAKRVFLPPEANRHYTADEARALAAALLDAANHAH